MQPKIFKRIMRCDCHNPVVEPCAVIIWVIPRLVPDATGVNRTATNAANI